MTAREALKNLKIFRNMNKSLTTLDDILDAAARAEENSETLNADILRKREQSAALDKTITDQREAYNKQTEELKSSYARIKREHEARIEESRKATEAELKNCQDSITLAHVNHVAKIGEFQQKIADVNKEYLMSKQEHEDIKSKIRALREVISTAPVDDPNTPEREDLGETSGNSPS